MIVLSAGMPKSGSTLLSFYQKNILERALSGNGQERFEQLIREDIISGAGFFVHNFEAPGILDKLIELSREIGPFVVKAHVPVTPEIRERILEKRILATYIHRDPRDVILSAIDHGKRQTRNPALNVFFERFQNVGVSIPLVREYCKTALDWIHSGLCTVFTYHDLIHDPLPLLKSFCSLLSVAPDEGYIKTLVINFTVDQISGRRQYNTGKLTRYREEMTPEDIDLCNRELKAELEQLGYPA